jgi:hypothetical protein
VTTFVSKPASVEAVQWTGDNLSEVLASIPDKTRYDQNRGLVLLAGADGAQEWVPVPVGHWLVHQPGDLSDVWPVDDAYFKGKYDSSPAPDDFPPAVPVEPVDGGGAWATAEPVGFTEDDQPTEGELLVRKLYATTDASVWAGEFMKIVNAMPPGMTVDFGFIVGWFANAIETAKRIAVEQYQVTANGRGVCPRPYIGRPPHCGDDACLLAHPEDHAGKSDLLGMGPDAPTTTNEAGGSQSHLPYRFDLIDARALFAMAEVLHTGAEKYGEGNWRLISIEDHLNHMIAHAYAYLAGNRDDDHLSHSLCRATFALGVATQPDGG